MAFIEKKFNIPKIEGISQKTIDEHLKLYAGYVKHANMILETIAEMSKYTGPDSPMGPGTTYAINEMQRRFGFEFNGIRNHEYYFEQLEGGPDMGNKESALSKQMAKDFGSSQIWFEKFKSLCMTRGIGWAILYYDKKTNQLLNAWVDEQHLGQLNGLEFIYGVDMWEHSYMLDYVPGDKKKYVESYLMATNQAVVEKRFENCVTKIA